jgi:uncharacterized protein YjbI with pentapeptide repeats
MSEEKRQEDIHFTINKFATRARNSYLWHIGILSYVALTLATTTDRTLVMYGAVDLFLLNFKIPMWWFAFMAVGLALLSYALLRFCMVQIHKQMISTQEELTGLNASRVPNWLESIAIDTQARRFVNLTLWYYMPIVMMMLPVWILRLQLPDLAYQMNGLVILCSLFVLWFWYAPFGYDEYQSKKLQYWSHPNQIPMKVFELSTSKFLLTSKFWRRIFFVFIFASQIGLTTITIPFASGELFVLDLSHQNMVSSPDKGKYNTILTYGSHFKGADLDGAIFKNGRGFKEFQNASLIFADFQIAELSRTQFQGADLSGADFRGALARSLELNNTKLDGTVFSDANISFSNFKNITASGVDFRRALMIGLRMTEVQLHSPNFRGADLGGARLTRGKFLLANFTDASLYDVDIMDFQLAHSRFQNANLTSANLSDNDLSNARFHNANLSQAAFHKSNLRAAYFGGANVEGASFYKADLREVEMNSVINLTAEQLMDAKTLFGAELPPEIEASLRESHPQLFEVPEEE